MSETLSTEVNLEELNLLMPPCHPDSSPFDASANFDDKECRIHSCDENDSEILGQDTLAKQPQQNRTADESMEEEELIQIEKEWLKLNSTAEYLESETDEEHDEIDDEDDIKTYPIQTVIRPNLLRRILFMAAVEASKSTIQLPRYSSALHDARKSKDTKTIIASIKRKKQPEFKENVTVKSNNKTSQEKELVREQKPRRRSTVTKDMEIEPENDIGNGYGDLDWCREFTQPNDKSTISEISTAIQSQRISIDSTNEDKTSSKIDILTPSWRIIPEYDDSESESAESMNIPTEFKAETIILKNFDCDSELEIRLVKLTDMQVQALRRRIKFASSKPCVSYCSRYSFLYKKRNIESQFDSVSDIESEDEYMKQTKNYQNTAKTKHRGNVERKTESDNESEDDAKNCRNGEKSRSLRYLEKSNKIMEDVLTDEIKTYQNTAKTRSQRYLQRNKEQLLHSPLSEGSSSCSKELARLQFLNAGPKMKVVNHKINPSKLGKRKESASYDGNTSHKKTTKQQFHEPNHHKNRIADIKINDTGSSLLTAHEHDLKTQPSSAKNGESMILMEDYNFDDIEVIIAKDCTVADVLDKNAAVEQNQSPKDTLQAQKDECSSNDTDLDVIMSSL